MGSGHDPNRTEKQAHGYAEYETHDRKSEWIDLEAGGDEFPLTQEFLGQMLGARRASVSEVSGRLQGEGLISYERGKIRVEDRAGLEKRSCECYGIIKEEFDEFPS